MTRLLQNEHHLLGEVGGFVDRLEVLEGPTGRRSWPNDVKARIVMESLGPGARVCDVARRNGLAPQHLSSWRGLARKGKLALPGPVVDEGPAFVALELEDPADPVAACRIEIEVDAITVRLAGDASAERIAGIAAALRAAR